MARFWNAEFAHFPRFMLMTEASLGERLEGAERLLLALEGEDIVGLIHGGITPEEEVRMRVRDWPGGTQGYIALFAVARAHRKRGIGTELWRCEREELSGTVQIVIDGDGRNPWYAQPPVFGAPWGPAVIWSDGETRKFLALRGYGARVKAVELDVGMVVPEVDPDRYCDLLVAGAKKVAEWAIY